MSSDLKMGREVAEQNLSDICAELGLELAELQNDDDMKGTINKLITAVQTGRLEYENGVFTQTLLSPVAHGDKQVTHLQIPEPTGAQLREMSKVKDSNDDVGKSMAVLGAVTGYGLPVINTMKSRDMMVSAGIISLFL